MRKVLFRVDGYSEIGYGHLVRSLALAREFNKRGNLVYFLAFVDDFCRHMIDRVGVRYIKAGTKAGERQDLECVNNLLSSLGIDIFVHDSYFIDSDYERSLKFDGIIMAIDDNAERQFFCDVLINQNYGAERYNYTVSKKDSKLLLGSKYVMLRPDLITWKKSRLEKDIKNILVMFGGTDIHGQCLRIANILSRSISDDTLSISVVIPSDHSTNTSLRTLAKKDRRIFIIHDVTNMGRLLFEMDLAIVGSGSTIWELLYVGVPVVSLILAENQEPISTMLVEAGYIKSLGWYNVVSDEEITEAIHEFLEDFDMRRELFVKGQQLIDGKGSERIVDFIRDHFYEDIGISGVQ